jgi:hypothetical protein
MSINGSGGGGDDSDHSPLTPFLLPSFSTFVVMPK